MAWGPSIARWLHLVCFATLAGGFQLLLAPEAETSGGEFPLFHGGWLWDKSVAVIVIALTGVYSAIWVYLPQWRRVPVLNGGRRRYFMALALKTILFVPAVVLVFVRPTLTTLYVCWFLFLLIFTLAMYMKHVRESTLNDNAPGVDPNAANPAVTVHRVNVDTPVEKRVVLPFKYRKGVCDETDPAHIRVRSPTATAALAAAAGARPSPPDDSRGPRYCAYCTSAVDIRHDAMCAECAAKYRVCAVCALHLPGTEPAAPASAASALASAPVRASPSGAAEIAMTAVGK